jgi:hypothetical protein
LNNKTNFEDLTVGDHIIIEDSRGIEKLTKICRETKTLWGTCKHGRFNKSNGRGYGQSLDLFNLSCIVRKATKRDFAEHRRKQTIHKIINTVGSGGPAVWELTQREANYILKILESKTKEI